MRVKPARASSQVVVGLRKEDSDGFPRVANGAIEAGCAHEVQRILVPLDFTDCSKKALVYAPHFARQSKARIILLHVLPARYAPGWKYDSVTGQWLVRDDLREHVEKSLAGLAGEIAAGGIPVVIEVRYGAVAQQIAYVAGERNVDLIIMATHGYRGLARALLGSVSSDVTRLAPCPVLVVSREKADLNSSRSAAFVNQRLHESNPGCPVPMK